MRRVALGAIAVAVASWQPAAYGGRLSALPQGATQAPATEPAPRPKPVVPVAASTLAATPDAYYDEPVSLAGMVDQKLSPTAFSVDQDGTKTTGQDVLVIVPTLQREVSANSYVTVIGDAFRFDAAAVAARLKNYRLDLPAEAVARYTGRPAVIASSVIDASGMDVARRLPPPMTADEQAYQKLMKQIGTSNGALRKGLEGSDTKAAAEHSATLRQSFGEVAVFWRGRRKSDALRWSQEARRLSEQLERAVAAAKWNDAKSHVAALGKTCQACHETYRERFDDGSFRIRKES